MAVKKWAWRSPALRQTPATEYHSSRTISTVGFVNHWTFIFFSPFSAHPSLLSLQLQQLSIRTCTSLPAQQWSEAIGSHLHLCGSPLPSIVRDTRLFTQAGYPFSKTFTTSKLLTHQQTLLPSYRSVINLQLFILNQRNIIILSRSYIGDCSLLIGSGDSK